MNLNWLDAGVAAFVLLGVLGGGKKGLLRSLGGVVCTGLALLAAVLWWQPVLTYLEGNYSAVTLLAQALQKQIAAPVFENADRMIPYIFSFLFYPYQNAIYNLARILLGVASFLALFFLVGITARALWELLSLLFRRGALEKVDRLGGGILGGLEAIIILAVMLGVAWSVLDSLARMQVEKAMAAREYLNASFSFPWLKELFDLMGKIIVKPWA